jgi:acetyl-CoA decarbonylase/synthase complex subunit epsilon
MVSEFLKRDYTPAGFMSAVDISNRFVDPEWKGLDGKGTYDLVMYIGLPYYMESFILSGLKHFAPDLKTMTLDNVFHPHASWSFPNASLDDWMNNLKVMTSNFPIGE